MLPLAVMGKVTYVIVVLMILDSYLIKKSFKVSDAPPQQKEKQSRQEAMEETT